MLDHADDPPFDVAARARGEGDDVPARTLERQIHNVAARLKLKGPARKGLLPVAAVGALQEADGWAAPVVGAVVGWVLAKKNVV